MQTLTYQILVADASLIRTIWSFMISKFAKFC